MRADWQNVATFLRVVELGSFTKAARALGHPTSTISRRIARLEEELATRLLHRTTRSLHLTDAGRVYYERALHAVAELEDAEHQLSESQRTPRGLVRVVAPSEHMLSSVLVRQFLRAHPLVRVELELTNQPVRLVEDGFDVAIQPGALGNSTTTIAHKLFDSPFALVASPDYLASAGAPRSVHELGHHDAIVFSTGGAYATWTLSDERGDVVDVRVKTRCAANHSTVALEACLDGLGIALLPLIGCQGALAAGELVEVLPAHRPPPVPIWILYVGGRHLPPAVRAFVDHVKAHFKTLALKSSGGRAAPE